MIRNIFTLLVITGLLLAVGCANQTTDPRKGGLFSYNPEAYEQRLADRKAEKERLEADTKRLQEEQTTLQAQTEGARAERDALLQKVADLDKDLNRVERRIARVRAKTKAQKHQLWKAQIKLKDTKRRIKGLKNCQATAKDKAEYDRLRKRLDQLMEEAAALSEI